MGSERAPLTGRLSWASRLTLRSLLGWAGGGRLWICGGPGTDASFALNGAGPRLVLHSEKPTSGSLRKAGATPTSVPRPSAKPALLPASEGGGFAPRHSPDLSPVAAGPENPRGWLNEMF